MTGSSNDNSAVSRDFNTTDAHGYAALALTESLLHSLLDKSLVNLADADDIVSIAINATQAALDDLPTRPASLEQSIFRLTDISRSLSFIK